MSSKDHINNLPPEILEEIQCYIHDEWLTFRSVCKDWSTIYCEYLYIKLNLEYYNIEQLYKSKELFHKANELTIYNTSNNELEIMNHHELFNTITKLYLKGNVNLNLIDGFVSNPNSFIYKLNYLSIDLPVQKESTDKQAAEKISKKLDEIYKKGMVTAEQHYNINSFGLFNFLLYLKNRNAKYLQIALESNFIEALNYCGKTSEWLLVGAKLGNLKLQLDLATLYYNNNEHLLALEMFEKVFYNLKYVEKNNKEINFDFSKHLGEYYYNGYEDEGININYKKALYYYFHANRNDPNILFSIGSCYNKLKDYKNSYKWYLKAENRGYSKIGFYYEHGLGVEQDYNSAFESYLKAAQLFFQGSLFKVSQFYCNGIGTSPNMEESIKYLLSSTKYSKAIIKCFNYLKLLNHLPNLDRTIKRITTLDNKDQKALSNKYATMNLNENEILQLVKPNSLCKLCKNSLNGFYYSTLDAFPLDLCTYCCHEETLDDRTLFKTHVLANFIPLLEYCKERNNINNQKLDNIINQLRECKSPYNKNIN